MHTHRLLIPVVALFIGTTAFAAAPASHSAKASGSAATRPAKMHAPGIVKSVDLKQDQVVVTINDVDHTLHDAHLKHQAYVKAGANVDVTWKGDKATSITLHKS